MKELPIIKEPSIVPRHCIIWLHGLGADGSDFVPVIDDITSNGHAIRFIFPHAPYRPVSLNGGMPMRAWYDLYGLTVDSPQDEIGIRASQQCLNHLIERKPPRIPPIEKKINRLT